MLFYLFAIDVSVAVIPNGWMGTAAKSRGVQYAAFCRFIAIDCFSNVSAKVFGLFWFIDVTFHLKNNLTFELFP